jgi:hypothetical protein
MGERVTIGKVMQKFDAHSIGVAQGDVILFSDFDNDGPMWTGEGKREARHTVTFPEAFRGVPSVTLSFSMLDLSNDAYLRADLQSDAVTADGFDIVFRTWGDSRIARIRVAWQAIGAVNHDDAWDI